MQFRVLGTVEIEGPDGPVALGGPRQRLLLATLLAARRRVVPLDALADALWGIEPPATARSTLQTSVSKLRGLLGDHPEEALVARPPGYVLDVPPAAVDADRFERDATAARALLADRPGEALDVLDRALGLWLGGAFAGYAELPWAVAEATRLEELRLQAIEDRNEARLAVGEVGTVIGELEGLTAVHPLRERLRTQLMVALQRSGRQAEALRVGASFRRHLAEELGLDPSASFARVERTVLDGGTLLETDRELDGDTAGAPSERPTIISTADAPRTDPSWQARPGPASASGTPPVGRDVVLDEIAAAVGESRLVTLTGPGGVGKSTIATEVARRLAPSFRDGTRVVELGSVSADAAVVAAVAQAVEAERRSGRSLTGAVVDVLGPRGLLLVIDNCEHVIGAVRELVAEVVRWCPAVAILATSREPIGLAGERVQPVRPLDVPTDTTASTSALAAIPSVALFVARAAEAAPTFELSPADAPAVAELCVRLDGLPLALELAAARMASMTPQQLLERLDERFALLGSRHGRVARHRSLSDVVQWSYALLDPDEQRVFARCSVFAGGFDLDAAEQTCADDLVASDAVARIVADLVDKSLFVATPDDEGFRYSLLETLRRFGADRLAEQIDGPQVHRAHVATFVDRARLGGDALDGEHEARWARRLERDSDNVRAAMTTAIAVDDVDSATSLVMSMAETGFRSIRYEVVDWAETVAAMDAIADHPLRPRVVAVVAYGAFVRGELSGAVELAERSVRLRDRAGVAPCGLPERVLGNACFYLGRRDDALRWMERLVGIARARNDAARLAHALYMRSVAQTSIGDPAGGVELAAEAEAAALASACPTALAQASYAKGLARAGADPSRAIELLEGSAAVAGSVGNRWMRCFALTESLWLRARRGELDLALVGYREVVDTWFRGGDWANQWLSLRHLAGILASLGRDEEAALLSGAVEAAGADSALPFAPLDAGQLIELSEGLEIRLGSASMARTKHRGARMRDDAVVSLALHTVDSLIAGRSGSG